MENNIRKEEKEIKSTSGKIVPENGNFTTKKESNPPFINTIIQDESYKANANKGIKDYDNIAGKKEK